MKRALLVLAALMAVAPLVSLGGEVNRIAFVENVAVTKAWIDFCGRCWVVTPDGGALEDTGPFCKAAAPAMARQAGADPKACAVDGGSR